MEPATLYQPVVASAIGWLPYAGRRSVNENDPPPLLTIAQFAVMSA